MIRIWRWLAISVLFSACSQPTNFTFTFAEKEIAQGVGLSVRLSNPFFLPSFLSSTYSHPSRPRPRLRSIKLRLIPAAAAAPAVSNVKLPEKNFLPSDPSLVYYIYHPLLVRRPPSSASRFPVISACMHATRCLIEVWLLTLTRIGSTRYCPESISTRLTEYPSCAIDLIPS